MPSRACFDLLDGTAMSRASSSMRSSMPVTDGPLGSAILLTHDRPDFVRAALEPIRSQAYQALEIIVSDDGPTDLKHRYASLEKARTEHPRLLSALREMKKPGRRVAGLRQHWAAER